MISTYEGPFYTLNNSVQWCTVGAARWVEFGRGFAANAHLSLPRQGGVEQSRSHDNDNYYFTKWLLKR